MYIYNNVLYRYIFTLKKIQMTRKDWFYVPLPLVMAKALDEIIEKEGKRYGIGDRSELIRIVLGEFIMKYDKDNIEVSKTLQHITDKILKNARHQKKKNY